MNKIIWYPLYMIVMIILYAFAAVKNSPRLVYNLFHRRKRAYWHPMDWLEREDYDPTESFYHE